jgi:hypothetical protein
LQVSIDKLDSNSYAVSDSYFQDDDLHLFVAINSSFIDGTMIVYKTAATRLLQSISKPQNSIIAVVNIDRYDSLSPNQLFSIQVFSVIFQVFAWLGVIGVILSIFTGYGVVM